ncbi:unnamed protein product [Staurois parvus]|uniref:Uncharacterized protein n=1 Tax=Staurois parvus TaxID=386267 RepID=A0ABN9ER55_9NEOB|nr:unnamed protein product [Staurois parvus]
MISAAPSVPPVSAINANCYVPSIAHISAHQCHISVPTSAHQCHISVPIRTAFQFHLSVPVSDAYQ